MVERRLFKNFDFALVFLMIVIIGFGMAMVYSAKSGGASGSSYVHRQMVWAVAGIFAFAIAASFDHKAYPRISGWIYAINILLLIAVFVLGSSSKGAQRWIGFGGLRIQPSEFAKISAIITLAAYFVRKQANIREFETFAKSLLHMALPMLLVLKQPDLGTTLVLTAIWLGMSFVAGVKTRHILLFVLGVAIIGIGGWESGALKPYQKARLITLVNPAANAKGAGYHVIQARIAIGSGQATGKGWMHGTQGQLDFVPENHTDFIFSVVAEEFGFIGAGLLLLLYFGLIWRGTVIMSETEDPLGRLMAGGVVTMFLFHIFVNVGMTMGIMPVTGIPLPLFSYGGSSLLTNMIALGILVGIGMRRHKINF